MKSTGLSGKIAALFSLSAPPNLTAGDADWPDLPISGFIAGRCATVEDAKQGNAVFSMQGQSDGVLPILVPQYVLWSDEAGQKYPMLLVQAERAPDGSAIVGLRDFKGQETVATLPEVELLGTKKPS